MNPHFSPLRGAHFNRLFALGLCSLGILQAPDASAKVYMEPLVYASSGKSDYQSIVLVDGLPNSLEVGYLIGYGANARFGVMNDSEEIFSAIELGVGQSALTGAGFGLLFSVGVTVGYTLKYTPLRLVMGYNLSEAYSDSRVSLGGSAFRAGIGYFLKENLLLNLDFSRRLYTEVSLASGASEVLPGEVGYNALQLSISIPMMFESAKIPWKSRYRSAAVASHTVAPPVEPVMEGSSPLEDNPPPPSDAQGELPPAPEGMAPPDAAPPPDEAAATPPEMLSPSEQDLLNVQ